MNSVLEKNLQVLRDHKPSLSEILCDCDDGGGLSPQIFGKRIQDLEAEATKWLENYSGIQSRIILVGGVGIGLKLCGVLAGMSEKQIMIVYESRPGRILAAMQIYDLSALFESPKVRIYTGAQSLSLFKNDIMETISSLAIESEDLHESESFRCNIASLISDISSPVEYKHYKRILEKTLYETKTRIYNDVLIHRVRGAAAEIAEFLKMNVDETASAIINSTKLISDDWKIARPETPGEIHEWYKKTYSYIFDLASYHLGSKSYNRTIELMENRIGDIAGPVLDFGGGDGDMTIRLARHGLDVTYCDVPGITMRYALWRFQRLNLNIRIIESNNPLTINLDRQYAAILALDVLEHLVNPIHHCEIFFKNLQPGGILIAKPSFSDDPDLFPMHLKSNVQYAKSFDSEMEKIGYRKLPPENDAVGFWEKPKQ
jgi:2-polyprenyl-3-methyl-5-hydroxy-6-metoxy-1,4-benzoquinol methylase